MRGLPALFLIAAFALSACGQGKEPAPAGGNFAVTATKNTTRISGPDPVALAASTAQAVFPGGEGDRPNAVALVDSGDWQTALAASVLVSSPVRAPVLFTDGTDLPSASAKALASMDPKGASALDGAQLIRIGKTANPKGRRSVVVAGSDGAQRAAAIDALLSGADNRRPTTVIITGSSNAELAAPAAALAAKTGAPILFTEKDSVPAATRDALAAHGKPQIVTIGPASTIGPKALAQLRKLGTVTAATRSSNSVRSAIEVARFSSRGFGWGIVDPGHGLVFARAGNAQSAVAAAPLSASGSYGPLLLLDGGELPRELTSYLRRIQPGYEGDPSRGIYNHGWIIGDQNAISADVQSKIDSLLEIRRAR